MASLVLSALGYLQEKTRKSSLLYNIKRAIFPLIIGTIAVSALFFSSTIAYFIFYWSYIPSVGITRDVHLQFSRDAPPWGSVDLSGTDLMSNQPYATFVEIELPRSRLNLDMGNFMVSLSLVSSSNETLAVSSRSAILTYTSPIISTSLTIFNSPFVITGLKKEAETLLILVMERYEFAPSRATCPRWAVVQIAPDGNKIHVYSTKLIFVAQFEGVRWFMYSHRIIAFILFTSMFFISSCLFAGLTWFILSLRSSGALPSRDDLHHDLPPSPHEKLEIRTKREDSPPDDDITVSPSLSLRPYPSSDTISQLHPLVTEPSSSEEYQEDLKRPILSESSTSPIGKDDDTISLSQIKTDDDEMTDADGQDDGTRTNTSYP